MRLARSFRDRLVRRPALGAVPAALLTLLSLPLAAGLEIDNTFEVWLDRDSAAWRDYESFRQTFGSEEFVLAVYECPTTVDLPFLERLTDLRFELEEIEGVRRVDDLARLYSRLYSLRGIEGFRHDLAASPFPRQYLISRDGRRAATWIHLALDRPSERAYVVAAVEEALGRAPPGGTVHLAGSPVLVTALDRSSRRAARTFFPLVFALSALVLLALFRRLAGVVIPFAAVGSGILWTLALVELAGRRLNMVTITLPPLVWVLGMSTSIHLLSRWSRILAGGGSEDEATRTTLTQLFRPCLYSALTTALGFASLAASSMQPVREMGVFAAAGVLCCLTSNFLLFPALISRSGRLHPPREDHPVLDALVRLNRRPRLTLVLSAAFALILAVAIPRLSAESNPIEFFRGDAPIAVTYERVLPAFTGPYSLEVAVSPPAVDLEAVRRLDELRRFVESREGVARTLSVVDLVKRAHQGQERAYRLPADQAAFEDVWQRLAEYPEELAAFAAGDELRMSVLARPMGSDAHQRLVEELRAHLDREVETTWSPRLTGIVPLLVDMQERLVDSQVRTLALASLMIAAVLGLLLRKASWALLSLAPNLLPIVFALGTMGWLGIPLDPATVMIAGIALGIAVDDTIHYLEHYRREQRAGRTERDAAVATLDAVGRPMIVTSLVAALGFLVLCFSDFVPLFNFGLLTAVTMVAALVGDLMVLPALLVLRHGRLLEMTDERRRKA